MSEPAYEVSLVDLAAQVYQLLEDGAHVASSLCSCDEDIYWEVAYSHARAWPEDKAVQMLSAWRAERKAA
jgi:hypothetical protein